MSAGELMQRLELIYQPPFPIDPGSPLDFRISTIPGAPAAALPGSGDARTLTNALAADPPHILGPVDDPVVIRGHRRIVSAHVLGLEEIPFLVYPPGTRKDVVAGMALRRRPKDLSGVEEIIALVKAIGYATHGDGTVLIPSESPLEGTIPIWGPMALDQLFGRPISPPYVDRLSMVLTWPSEELIRLHELSLAYQNIASLIDLTGPERRAAIKIREAVPLTTGELKNLTRLLVLARGRKRFDLDAWLDGELSDRDEPRTGSELLNSLRSSIHPRLTDASKRIEEEIRGMGLPNRLKITAPENLEGGSFSCYFRFSNNGELDEHVGKLKKIIKDGSAKRILGMLDPADKDNTK
jgi:hypothetical protein